MSRGGELLRIFTQKYCLKNNINRNFRVGDVVVVTTSYFDNGKEKNQKFKGVVIQRRHTNTSGETFSIFKVSDGVNVEKTFYINSPNVKNIEIVNHGKVRRARIFFLRNAKGKDAKVKTKFIALQELTPKEKIEVEKDRYDRMKDILNEKEKRDEKLEEIKEASEKKENAEGSAEVEK